MAQKFTVPITVKQLTSAGSDAVTVYVDADTYARLKVEAGGRLVWGDGSAVGDVNLYRDSANVLRTDDTFKTPTLFVDNIEIDTTGAALNDILVFNGTKFGSASASFGGGGATISDTPPASPVTGQIWYESDTGKTFVYYDSFWIEIVGSTGAQGPTGASGSSDLSSGLTSGTYYTTTSNTNTSTSTSSTTGTVSYLPFLVEETTTFDRIACKTGSTVTGTSTVRLGIYNNSNKKPTTVLLDAGTVAATATNTIYSITINQTLNPGWYWLAHVVNSTTGTHSFNQVADALPFGQMPLSATFSFQPNYTQTGVTGAFATASPTATGSNRILVALRVA